jgi:hypothetical protein
MMTGRDQFEGANPVAICYNDMRQTSFPYLIQTYAFPKGKRIQNVILLERTGQVSASGLRLPMVLIRDAAEIAKITGETTRGETGRPTGASSSQSTATSPDAEPSRPSRLSSSLLAILAAAGLAAVMAAAVALIIHRKRR